MSETVERTPGERLREYPETLRELAESDRESSWVYQRVRDAIEEGDL